MAPPLEDGVTVIVPTRHRPELVARAVASALAQTHRTLEVVVVVDGPDEATTSRLATIEDSRLRILSLPTNGGAAAARNAGVAVASYRWIAFLDDDDQWVAHKIATQMAARPEGLAWPIISCRCMVLTAKGRFVWPRRLAKPDDAIADYLFVRRGLFKGETFAPTSTLLCPRALLQRHPFPHSLFDDWEWLITCGREPGCALVTVPSILAIHYTESAAVTLSTCRDIEMALGWVQAMRPRVSRRAYASLLMQAIGGEAMAREARIRRRILSMALRDGRPTLAALATFFMHSALPVGLRRQLRRAFFAIPGCGLW